MPVGLNDSQKRHFVSLARHIATLLDEIDRILVVAAQQSPFRAFVNDLSPPRKSLIRELVGSVRAVLIEECDRFGLDRTGTALDVRHVIDTQAIMASIAVEEMRAKYLRGYGALSPESAREVERTADAIERALRELKRAAAPGEDEDLERRIARLETKGLDPGLLPELERIVREYKLTAFRPILKSVIERAEERTLHIALFGRVSSGKSSLLNAILGASILPVGVTPITAVPTRVRLGSPASIHVLEADGSKRSLPLDRLDEFASERNNPGNRKKVTRLGVVYPPPPGLPEGVEFVDTPGIGSLALSGARETLDYLPRADIAIVLTDIGSSLSADEIDLIRRFFDAAIPFEIVLTKADIVDAPSRRESIDFTRRALAATIPADPPISAVSAMESGRPMLDAWLETRIRPVLGKKQELAEASLRRIAQRLRETVVSALTSGVAPSGATAAAFDDAVRRADDLVAAVRGQLEAFAESRVEETRRVIRAAAVEIAARWEREGPRSIALEEPLAAALRRLAAEDRESIASTLGRLAGDLTPLAGSLGEAAAELWSTLSPSLNPDEIPSVDLRPLSKAGDLRRPMVGAPSPNRLQRLISRRATSLISSNLRDYGWKIRDWTAGALNGMARAFHAAAAPARPLASTSEEEAVDLKKVEIDLARLESLSK